MKQNLFIALVLLSLLLTACSSATPAATATPEATASTAANNTIIAEGRLEPIRYADIAFTASGIVGDVPVQEGQAVKKGDTLVRLGDDLDTNFAAAKLELVNAQKALNDLKLNSGIDLAQAAIDLKDAHEAYDDAVKDLNELKNSKEIRQVQDRARLVQTPKGPQYVRETRVFKGPAPKDQIIDAENKVGLKKAKLDAAQRTYDRMKEGVDAEQLAVLEARLNAAKASLATFYVTAPFDGVVARMNAKAGGSIKAGEVAVTIADFSDWLIKTTDLTEIDVVQLAEDQPVVVALDALPGVELKGKILSIGQNYSENQGDVVYEVTVLLNDKHPEMRWGMTASVTFKGQD